MNSTDVRSDFYHISRNVGGTVDVWTREIDASGRVVKLHVVRGVEPFDGIEDDIRARFGAWMDTGEAIEQRMEG